MNVSLRTPPPPPPPPPAAQRLRENWDAALAWYSGLFKRGGWWIAVALLLPCCACSVMWSGAQSVGLIPKAATATPRPTSTARPTSTPRPTRPPRATDTAEPPTATDVPATDTPRPTRVLPTEAPATRAPQGLISAPPVLEQPPAATAEPGPPHPEYDAGSDLNCDDFSGHADAQAWWNYWHARGVANPGGLDGNGDGVACQNG